MATIAERFHSLEKSIAERSSGRKVTIVGVAKGQPLERILEATAAGLMVVGDNYVQEGEVLQAAYTGTKVQWHFVGHIQSRKAKELIGYDMVQSVDRPEIAQGLDRRLVGREKPLDVLIEVNIGREPTKSGILPDELTAMARLVHTLPHLRLRGLMAMPPPLESLEERRPFFREVAAMGKALGTEVLSMGTSQDYLIAVEEGATMVRLGESLFGPR